MNIAIIEDRINRLRQYSNFHVENNPSVSIITGTDFSSLSIELSQNNTSRLESYDCIALHRSALTNTQRTLIIEYCKANNTPLIFFSGGISTDVLKLAEFPFLHINSKNFYSDNLKLFIEESVKNNKINLHILQFGILWKISLLLNLRDHIARAINLHHLKTNENFNIDNSELIRRERDLQLNPYIKAEFTNQLTGNDSAEISHDKLNDLKYTIDDLINKLS